MLSWRHYACTIFFVKRERGKTLWWEGSYLWQKKRGSESGNGSSALGWKMDAQISVCFWAKTNGRSCVLKLQTQVCMSFFIQRPMVHFSFPFPSLLFSSQVGHSWPDQTALFLLVDVDQTAFFYLVDGRHCRTSILLRFSSSPLLWVWTWKYPPCLA